MHNLESMVNDALLRVNQANSFEEAKPAILHALLVLKLIAAKLATGELHPRPL
jgi:hypothetical protein